MSDDDTAIRLLEQALFLRMNGERPPGAPRDDPAAETWRDWDRRAEAFLRKAHRDGILSALWAQRCELSPEVVKAMDDEALAGHLRDAHTVGC